MRENKTSGRTSTLVLVGAWLVVAIPAAWGVSQTVLRSLDLLIASRTAAVSPPTPQ